MAAKDVRGQLYRDVAALMVRHANPTACRYRTRQWEPSARSRSLQQRHVGGRVRQMPQARELAAGKDRQFASARKRSWLRQCARWNSQQSSVEAVARGEVVVAVRSGEPREPRLDFARLSRGGRDQAQP